MAEHEVKLTANNVPGSTEIVELPSNCSVVDAFRSLVDKHVRSAPVWDEAEKKYLGFFDTSDFLCYVVAVIEKQNKDSSESPVEFCDLNDLLQTVSELHPDASKVSSVCNASGNNPYYNVMPSMPLSDIFTLLADQGLHRITVVDPLSHKISKIISQSNITSFLMKHPAVLAPLKGITVEASNFFKSPVVSVKESDLVIEAFYLMRDNKLSGIAVVDENGKLISSISNSDLRAVVKGKAFQFNACTVLEFLQRSRAMDGPNVRPAVVTVTMQTSLYDAMSKLAATGLHRLYVTNPEHDLLGVISLKDILRFLILSTKD